MKKLFSHVLLLSSFIAFVSCNNQEKATYVPRYSTVNDAIIGQNTGRYNNRPLYVNNTNAFILTGDQPIARLAKDQNLYGTFMMGIERNGKGKWLQQCDQITSIYNPGRMSWEITDAAFPGLKIKMEILPMVKTTGMAVSASVEGAKNEDKLIWAFGGAQLRKGRALSWGLDVMVQPKYLEWGFTPEECKNNIVENTGDIYFVNLPDSTGSNKLFATAISCNAKTKATAGEASAWSDPATFIDSQSHDLPILNGTITPENGKMIYWAFEAFNQSVNPDVSNVSNPENAFNEGLKRTESYKEQIKDQHP